ncbi:phosphoribosylamine--glycine ligase, partial [Dehalococcoidia bacterium]|nr:phosphoribosylamine--glycine ligase [Dehalococcoidia bacterium]
MRILVVGSGAREHALAWKIRQSPGLDRLFTAPGNAGTASIAQNLPISPTDIPALIKSSQENGIDLVVVGPETPLALGIVDALQQAGIPAFGPSR